jgi:hypothetical protein
MLRKGEKLVWSTRWFDDEADKSDAPAHLITIEVVIHDEERDERLAALSRRPNLFGFLKNEVRSHAFA